MLEIPTENEGRPPQGGGAPAFNISLSDIIDFIRTNLLFLIGLPILGFVCGIFYLLNATPRYTAAAQVTMETEYTDITRITSVGSFDTSQVESQLTLLKSDAIAKAVIKDLKLDEKKVEETAAPPGILDYVMYFVKLQWIGPYEPVDAVDETLARENALIRKVQSGLVAQRVGYSYVIQILYTARTPKLAAKFANAFAQAYVTDKLEQRVEAARRGATWLETHIDRLRRQMNQAALDVQVFKARGDYRLQKRSITLGAQPFDPPVKGKEKVPVSPDLDQPTLEELESRALTYRKIFESYLQTYADTLQKQSYPVTNARVLSRAFPPSRPSKPKKLLVLVASIIVGGAIGFGIALIRYNLPGLRSRFAI